MNNVFFSSKEWCTVLCTQSNRQFLCKSCDLEDKECGTMEVPDLVVGNELVWKTSKGTSYDVKLLRVHGKIMMCIHFVIMYIV